MLAPAFSSRLPPILAPNAVSRAVARLRGAGATLLDLTQSNPTEVGIAYPADSLASLADARALHHTPWPLGLAEAREAVAADYLRRQQVVPADRIVLTSSTS